MNLQDSTFENLINSFKKISSSLEAKAEFDLKQIEKECGQEFAVSAKSLRKFNEIINGITETCSEVVGASEILKRGAKSAAGENTIDLPYEIQSDFVKCISELYNVSCIGIGGSERKLVNEKNKQVVSELTKMCEKNICEIRDVENTLVEAKEIL